MKNRTHSIERAHERYGVSLTPLDVQEMERTIQRGESTLIGNQTKHRIKVIVTHNSKRFAVMYCKRRNSILTILPDKVLDCFDRGLKDADRPCRKCRSNPPSYPNGYCRTCQSESNRKYYRKKLAMQQSKRACRVCGRPVRHESTLSICSGCMIRCRK